MFPTRQKLKVGRCWVARLAVMLFIVGMAVDGQAGSIFDEDWQPPVRRPATPKEGPPTITPPARPSSATLPSTPISTPITPPTSPQVPPPRGLPDSAMQQIATRRVVPVKAEQDLSRLRMKEYYAKQLADASPAARDALAARLLADAARVADSPSDQFVVLYGAYTAGIEAGNLVACLRAADLMEEGFHLDAIDLKIAAATKVPPRSKWPGITARNLRAVVALIDLLTEAQAYAEAKAIGDKWNPVASQDALVKPILARKLGDIDAVRSREPAVAKALVKLETAPDDPAANLLVGSHSCFFMNRWSEGLPLLAKGSDATLKALADRELQGVENLQLTNEIADGWWGYGERQTPVAKLNILGHAATLYRKALPGLTGLVRKQATDRIGTAGELASPKLVDLLTLVVPESDGIVGTWTLSGGALFCESAKPARIEIPYIPGAEYDVCMKFRRLRGNDSIVIIGAGGGRQFLWSVGSSANRVSGISWINGRGVPDNATSQRAAAWIINDQAYTTVMRVRRSSIATELDGRTIVNWNGDFATLSLMPDWHLRRGDTLGIKCTDGAAVIESMDLIDRSDSGRPLRQPARPQPAASMLPPPVVPVTPVTPPAQPQSSVGHQIGIVDLLKLVDIDRDQIYEGWHLERGELVSDERASRKMVRFGYRPPAEYDYTLEFTTSAVVGYGGVGQICAAPNGRSFNCIVGTVMNTLAGIDMVAGQAIDKRVNSTAVHSPAWLTIGRRTTAVVEVRRDHVRMLLDGKEIVRYRTDFSDVDLAGVWAIGSDVLGVSAWNAVRIHRAEVREISGPGRPIRRLPADHISKTQFPFSDRPGSAASLTTLKPWAKQTGVAELLINQALRDRPVMLNERQIVRYLFAHAPSSLIYQIPDGAIGFRAMALINNPWGNARCLIYIDGHEAVISKGIKESGGSIPINLPLLKTARRIELRFEPLGKIDWAHTIWAEPEFLFPVK